MQLDCSKNEGLPKTLKLHSLKVMEWTQYVTDWWTLNNVLWDLSWPWTKLVVTCALYIGSI